MAKKKTKKKRKDGRPPALTAAVSKAIIESVRGGNFLNASASAGGVSYATVNEWRKRGEGRHPTRLKTKATAKFANDLREAEDEHQRKIIGILMENAVGYETVRTEETVSPDGKTTKIVISTVRDHKAPEVFLKIRYPGLFKPEQVDHKHSHTGEITVLSPEDQAIASRIMSSRLSQPTPN